MSEADLIKILIGSQSALAGMLIWHLFRCRDVRNDIAGMSEMLKGISGRLDRIERREDSR